MRRLLTRIGRGVARAQAPLWQPCHGTFRAAFVTVTVALFTFYSVYSTVGTGTRSVLLLQQSDEMREYIHNLPDTWRAEAQRRYDNHEISGYQLQLEMARANRMRRQADIVAHQLGNIGERQAWELASSSFMQAAFSLAFNQIADKVAAKMAPDVLATLPKKVATKLLKQLIDQVKAGGAPVTPAHLIQAIQDTASTEFVSRVTSPTIDVGEQFRARVRELERQRERIGKGADNELMAAHMMSVINDLDRIRKERPEEYDEAVRARADKLDKFLKLTEARQRVQARVVQSQWKNTQELSQWLHAQVQAKQKAKEEKKRAARLRPSFQPYPPQGKAPLQVRFDAGATRGDVESFQWDFGDDYSGEGLIAAHVYKAPGEYDVTLTVTGADGQSKSTTRRVTVVPGEEGEVSVDVSASPTQAQPGGKLTVVVQPKVTGVEEGELTVEVAIDGRRIYSDSRSGALEGDLSRTVQYGLPKDIAAGNHQVRATAQLRTDPEAEPVAALDTATFRVEGKTSGLDAFLGRWTGQVTLPTSPPSTVSMTLNITQVDESHIRVSINSPHPSATPRSDVYTVTGNRAVFRRNWFEKDYGYEHFEEVKFLVVGGGKVITGSSLERVFDPGPPREELGAYRGAFHAVRVQEK